MKKMLLMGRSVCFLLILSVVFFSGVSVVKAADTTVVSINPVNQTVLAGDILSITVACSPQQAIKAFELKVSFDPSLLQATNVTEGNIFNGFTTFFNAGIINNTAGTIIQIYGLILGSGNVTDAGVLVTINFTAKFTNGTSALSLDDVGLTNELDYIGDITVASGTVTVVGGGTLPPDTAPDEPSENPPSLVNTPPFPPLKPIGWMLANIGTVCRYSSAASDPDGDLVRLRFDWGGGSLSNWTAFVTSNTSVSASHAWVNVSTYSIRVIAQDANGVNSSWSDPFVVTISQKGSPVGWFNISESASSNQTIVFDTSEIYDPDGMIVSYLWNYGDGTTGVGENPVHTYQGPGKYTVTLIVIDNAGLRSTFSKVVSIAAGSGTPTNNENNFLQSNSSVIILSAVVVLLLILLFVFKDSIELFFVQNRIEASRRRLTQFEEKPADTNQKIYRPSFVIHQKEPIPMKDSILGASNDLLVGKAEEDGTSHHPDLSIEEIENLVDRHIRSKIETEVDKL